MSDASICAETHLSQTKLATANLRSEGQNFAPQKSATLHWRQLFRLDIRVTMMALRSDLAWGG